jgi:hypothetical protein
MCQVEEDYDEMRVLLEEHAGDGCPAGSIRIDNADFETTNNMNYAA